MTYQLNMALSDDLAAALKEYAGDRDVSLAAAVRFLLHQALEGQTSH